MPETSEPRNPFVIGGPKPEGNAKEEYKLPPYHLWYPPRHPGAGSKLKAVRPSRFEWVSLLASLLRAFAADLKSIFIRKWFD